MSKIRTGLEWLRSQQDEHLTDPVTLKRGGDTVVVNAMVADVQDNPLQLSGVVTGEWRTHFIIAVADYTVATVAVKPDESDTFTDAGGDIYSVSRDSTGDFWRYADETKLAYRVYTSLYEDVT